MLSTDVLRAVLLAGAVALPACTLQRASAMARPASDEAAGAPAPRGAPASAAAPAPPEASDEPTAGSDPEPGSEIVRAHATVLVRAPVARVRAVLFDCPRYPAFLTDYRACADVGPSAHGGREWLMDIEELGGLIKLRIRAEILKVPSPEGVEAYEGRLVSGNVKSFASAWRLERTARGFTRLTLASHLDPHLPLPNGLINGGSVDGIRDAILAVKRRAESDAEAKDGAPGAPTRP